VTATTPLLRCPGVYRAQQDTWLLSRVVVEHLHTHVAGCAVLEVGCGSGALAVSAAGHPGVRVTAVDLSLRAVLCTWANAAARGRRVRVRRGDLTGPVAGEVFDLIIANPPYVPGPASGVPDRGAARAWDAGQDGRAVLDRLCAEAPKALTPGGTLLLVQSALAGVAQTLHQLRGDGLDTEVVASSRHPFDPVLTARIPYLTARGWIRPAQTCEQLTVIRATSQGSTPPRHPGLTPRPEADSVRPRGSSAWFFHVRTMTNQVESDDPVPAPTPLYGRVAAVRSTKTSPARPPARCAGQGAARWSWRACSMGGGAGRSGSIRVAARSARSDTVTPTSVDGSPGRP